MSSKMRVIATVLALLSAVPQCFQYWNNLRQGSFQGSVYGPRIDATLAASTATLQGGPFATVPVGDRYSVAAGLINDLGVATLTSLWARLTGLEATTRTLGWINLLILVASCIAIVGSFPARFRLWLAPVFLFVPIVVTTYNNVDSVAFHGALALMAVAAPLWAVRSSKPWIPILAGLALFAVHKLRLVYAVYALMVLFPAVAVSWAVFKDRRALKAAALLLLAFGVCEVPWRIAVANRLSDPRLVEHDALPEHATYEALISGLGWTANPWGIKPEDPWVAQFLADTFHGPVVNIASAEGERRARTFYLSLARQQPGALARLYVGRIPSTLSDYSLGGTPGAAVWAALSFAAPALAIRRRDIEGFLIAIFPIGVAVALILQSIVIDNRYIYSYPLRLISAVVLAATIPITIRNARKPPELPARDAVAA